MSLQWCRSREEFYGTIVRTKDKDDKDKEAACVLLKTSFKSKCSLGTIHKSGNSEGF